MARLSANHIPPTTDLAVFTRCINMSPSPFMQGTLALSTSAADHGLYSTQSRRKSNDANANVDHASDCTPNSKAPAKSRPSTPLVQRSAHEAAHHAAQGKRRREQPEADPEHATLTPDARLPLLLVLDHVGNLRHERRARERERHAHERQQRSKENFLAESVFVHKAQAHKRRNRQEETQSRQPLGAVLVGQDADQGREKAGHKDTEQDDPGAEGVPVKCVMHKERYDGKEGVPIGPCPVVGETTENGRQQEARIHGPVDPARRPAHPVPEPVREQRQADRPADGRAQALQRPAERKERQAPAQAQQERRAGQRQQAREERQPSARRRAVGDEAKDGATDAEAQVEEGEEDAVPPGHLLLRNPDALVQGKGNHRDKDAVEEDVGEYSGAYHQEDKDVRGTKVVEMPNARLFGRCGGHDVDVVVVESSAPQTNGLIPCIRTGHFSITSEILADGGTQAAITRIIILLIILATVIVTAFITSTITAITFTLAGFIACLLPFWLTTYTSGILARLLALRALIVVPSLEMVALSLQTSVCAPGHGRAIVSIAQRDQDGRARSLAPGIVEGRCHARDGAFEFGQERFYDPGQIVDVNGRFCPAEGGGKDDGG
ncbi:hypothetical protein PWT90_01434 [Aphanocladium album]|nr:hypothetical protein PWT90_01434 [Aphanocladium album]